MLLKKFKTGANILIKHDFDFFLYILKKKLFFINGSYIPRKKIILLKKYSNYFSDGIVKTNYYKNTVIKFYAKNEKVNFASKILGYYEIEIQKELIKLQKKYKVKNFVQFGVAEGFHLIGLANKSITTLPLVSLIQASFTFHSKGIFQSKTFFPDFISLIFKELQILLSIFNVFLLPSPVRLLFIGHNFLIKFSISFCSIFEHIIKL